MKASLSAKPKSKPAAGATPTDSALFLRLYCACLSGAASQREQVFNDEDGRYCGDVFSSDAKSLLERESFAVKRAFRMASLALEEWEIARFNQDV
jgi:hypothetical protein